jgi:hypothetical protein
MFYTSVVVVSSSADQTVDDVARMHIKEFLWLVSVELSCQTLCNGVLSLFMASYVLCFGIKFCC